jgi:cation transport ATPase
LGVLVCVEALSVDQPKVKEARKQKVRTAVLRCVDVSRYASWPLSGVAFLLSFILSWDKIWGASAADAKEWWVLPLLIVGVLLSYGVFWLSRPEKEGHSMGDLHGEKKGCLVAGARRLWGRLVGNDLLVALAVVVIILMVVVALSGFWQGWWSRYEAMNLFFVGVLVVVTVLYAGATKRMADEMQRQRYASLLPILSPKGIPERIEVLETVLKEPLYREWLSVENVGPGPAMRVSVRVEGEKEEYFLGVVAAGRMEPVRGAKPGEWETTGELRLTIIYEDVYGRKHETTACLTKVSGRWDVDEVRQRPKPQ